MKKVLLVYPYFYTGVVLDQLFPPLGIALLSAALKEREIEVLKLDCTFLSMEEAIRIAEEYDPQIIGIYVMTTFTKNAMLSLEMMKNILPKALYVAGGPLPTLYPNKFAERFDYVFKGEAAVSFPNFCADYFKASDSTQFLKGIPPENYPGIHSLDHGEIDSPAVHLSKEEIDNFCLPDRNGFAHESYQKMSLDATGTKRTTIMMTYGCPYSCDFCSKPIFGNQVRFRSLDRIFEEIRDLMSYGYDSLWIADDLFTCDSHFLEEFCERLSKESLKISWSCLSRVDSITEDIAKKMKNAGCSKVYLGIESGNDQVLKLMRKGTNITNIRKGVDVFTENGIRCSGFFIVGYPGETEDTIEDTFAFALSLGLDEISFNVPYPLPGSKLYERVSGIKEEDWTFENETRFLFKSEFDENWLKKRIQETLKEFKFQKQGYSKTD